MNKHIGRSVAGSKLDRTNLWAMTVTVEVLLFRTFKAPAVLVINSKYDFEPSEGENECATSKSGGI